MIKVTINFLTHAEQDRYSTHQVVSQHRCEDVFDAIEKAVRKLYGKKTWFKLDSPCWNGQKNCGYYGVVYRSLSGTQATAVSAKLRIDVC